MEHVIAIAQGKEQTLLPAPRMWVTSEFLAMQMCPGWDNNSAQSPGGGLHGFKNSFT